MTKEIVIPEESKKLAEEAKGELTIYQDYKVSNFEGYSNSISILKEIKGKHKTLTAKRKDLTDPLNLLKGRIMDFFRQPLEFLEKAEAIVKNKAIAWKSEADRKKREEEAILAEKARKKEAKLRERARVAAEKGKEEKAEELEEQAEEVSIMQPVVQSEAEKVSGSSFRIDYKAEVTSLLALVAAVAAGEAPVNLIKADTVNINSLARTSKGKAKVSGIKFTSKENMSIRA